MLTIDPARRDIQLPLFLTTRPVLALPGILFFTRIDAITPIYFNLPCVGHNTSKNVSVAVYFMNYFLLYILKYHYNYHPLVVI